MTFNKFWKEQHGADPDVPKIFCMSRGYDESGTSGTGHVLDGVVFPSGKTVVCWDPEATEAKVDGESVNSVAVYDSFEAFLAIHVGQHPDNKTQIIFLN